MSLLSRFVDARLASLAVVVIAFLAALFLTVDAWAWWRQEHRALVELERHTGLLEQKAEALGRSGADETTSTDIQILVYGETPGLAAAELQRILGVTAGKVGATLRSVDAPQGETLAESHDAEGNQLQRVRLSAQIEVNEGSLPDLLYAIETERPAMIVDTIDLRPNRRNVETSGTGWIAPEDQPLLIRVDISAFRSGTAQ